MGGNSFLVLAFILMVTIQREHDFCYFRSLFKNSNLGGTSEVAPVKFWGVGRSVFVLSTEECGLGVRVGTQNGAVSFFSILEYSSRIFSDFDGFPQISQFLHTALTASTRRIGSKCVHFRGFGWFCLLCLEHYFVKY